MTTLTNRQRELLNFINKFNKDKGYYPTIREMCAGLKLKSTSSIKYQLDKLKEKGCIEIRREKKRALKIKDNKEKDYKSMWNKLKEYLLEEKEEVDVLIDPCAEEYEALCNISGALNRIINTMEELEEINND